MFYCFVEQYADDAGRDGRNDNIKQFLPVLQKQVCPVFIKAGQECKKCPAMQGNIKCHCIDLPVPAEKPGEKDKVSSAADREEFCYPLYYAEYYCLENLYAQMTETSVLNFKFVPFGKGLEVGNDFF